MRRSEDPRLHRILTRLIFRSFPRLRRVSLRILWGAPEDVFLGYVRSDGQHVIRVHESLRPAPRIVLEGGIAHELCHVDADSRMGPYQLQAACSRYAQSRWFRMREERAIECRVLELGYGLQLLAFVRFARRLGWSFSREHGLLYAELVRAVRS